VKFGLPRSAIPDWGSPYGQRRIARRRAFRQRITNLFWGPVLGVPRGHPGPVAPLHGDAEKPTGTSADWLANQFIIIYLHQFRHERKQPCPRPNHAFPRVPGHVGIAYRMRAVDDHERPACGNLSANYFGISRIDVAERPSRSRLGFVFLLRHAQRSEPPVILCALCGWDCSVFLCAPLCPLWLKPLGFYSVPLW